ncbi:MAG: hypothetical protein CFE23_14395 [Flavobacterium sp. BFFFF1]|uniref:KAP family P-loop NTPase fold protein n=1 Tax=Flavobacterium sp. BFFFF1 TaxID=2015557 RepID=UPI000BC7E7DD|nr:P-loop NTPase fold protein [Flavobacterium sp. BFFFF1]OYU79355.1 MAG: hypothetical protein CFE23_14395 [Flavobacterium sp. BFFFF1]
MIRHNDIQVLAGQPFVNCKLGRQKYANVLTGIIKTYPNGFVLAINNKWGTGKTTFVKMWEQELKDNNYQTVYFNAWENDFENNPLTALMGELKTLTTAKNEPTFKRALKNAAAISKHLIPTLVKALADNYFDTDNFKDALVDIAKGVTDIFEKDVNEYAERKKSISEFRKCLAEFIANTNDGKPLVFIVDELDRCRPNYAVLILEQIKHFFSVPNIIFVLSIDKEQLGYAIKGVYGSDNIDSDEYLRRFIDIEYSIPEPEKGLYYKYLYNYFDFADFFKSVKRREYPELASDEKQFLEMSSLLFGDSAVSLRQQEKVFSIARLALRSFQINHYVVPEVYLFLSYIKILSPDLYNNIKLKRLSINELQDRVFLFLKNKINEDNQRNLIWFEAYFILFYNNYIFGAYNQKNLYEREGIEIKLKINSIINPAENDYLLEIFKSINRQSNGNLDIGHLMIKLDLTEDILV